MFFRLFHDVFAMIMMIMMDGLAHTLRSNAMRKTEEKQTLM